VEGLARPKRAPTTRKSFLGNGVAIHKPRAYGAPDAAKKVQQKREVERGGPEKSNLHRTPGKGNSEGDEARIQVVINFEMEKKGLAPKGTEALQKGDLGRAESRKFSTRALPAV